MEGDEDDDTIIDAGTEGEGAEGQDTGGGDEETALSAEHADDEGDGGERGEGEVKDGGGEAEGAKPSRGGNRFQRLSNENRELRARVERAEREREQERRQQWQQRQELTEEQERERLAFMTPDERAQYRIDKMERRIAQERIFDRVQTQSMLDKAGFDAKAAVNPVYARHADEVERRFQDQLAQGRPVDRELILKVLLGERALTTAASATRQAGSKGRQKIAAQKVASGSGKGDTASTRGRAGETPETRLKDVII